MNWSVSISRQRSVEKTDEIWFPASKRKLFIQFFDKGNECFDLYEVKRLCDS